MGKSYRKTPIVKDWNSSTKFRKRQANKKVRRFKQPIADGKMFRKITNPWDIYDQVSYHSVYDWMAYYESALKQFENGTYSKYRDNVTREDVEAECGYDNWASYFLRR